MCHPEVPAGTALPEVRVEDVAIDVDDGVLPGLLALPVRTPAPGVLVVNDVFGRSDFYDHLTRRIAQAGFVALDVEYFFRQAPVAADDREGATARARQLDQMGTLDDLDQAVEWLKARPEVKGARAGTIGFCMGGTLVLDLAASRTDLATVCYYGFPARRGENPLAAPAPLEVADEMSGPILGEWGDQDAGVGMENVRALDEKLKAAGIEHSFHIYEGLGHGFLKAFLDKEGAPGHEQACESWKRTLEFWRTQLR
jgi:carboxymethylenebutenolidase